MVEYILCTSYEGEESLHMSLQKINTVLKKAKETDVWTAFLIKVKNSTRVGTTYAARDINLKPTGATVGLVHRIIDRYINEDNSWISKKLLTVVEYDGTAEETNIYRLNGNNQLIKDEFNALKEALSNPERDGNPFEFKATAYGLKSSIDIDGEPVPITMLSMQNPVGILKNRFYYEEDTFQEMRDKVLNLRPVIDVLIIGNEVYMFTMQGENLFNMERSYKAVCKATVIDICQTGIINNDDLFSGVAQSGRNPRRFVSFQPKRLEQMKDTNFRVAISKKFEMDLTDDNLIDTTAEGVAEKLVKLLCKKGMIDPFEDAPVEVPSVSKW